MISFQSVSKKYPGLNRLALHNVSLDIQQGEFVFLIGPSGSGKSTLLQSIVKDVDITTGDLWVDDFHVNRLHGKKINKLRQSVGYVYQDFRLLNKMNVYDNVAFTLEVIGKKRSFIRRMVPDVLEMVGLGPKQEQFPNALSGGEQQRVAIARAFANRPKILLADEPTGNLDPETADGIVGLLDQINEIGTTVVMATHNFRAVDAMRRRVIEMRLGNVLRDEDNAGYEARR